MMVKIPRKAIKYVKAIILSQWPKDGSPGVGSFNTITGELNLSASQMIDFLPEKIPLATLKEIAHNGNFGARITLECRKEGKKIFTYVYAGNRMSGHQYVRIGPRGKIEKLSLEDYHSLPAVQKMSSDSLKAINAKYSK